MTPEAKRIAIAEACGFIRDDFLNDLNAIHSAEMTLTDEELDERFYYWLGFVVSGGQKTNLWKWRKTIVHADAAQRAEAFLRTLGKWIETPTP